MVRIAGDDYPAEVVKSRFLKRNSAHIQYARCRLPMVRMYESTDCERNIPYFLVGLLKIRLKSLHQKWTQHTKGLLENALSLRTSAHAGVAIPRIFKHFGSKTSLLPFNRGAATPVTSVTGSQRHTFLTAPFIASLFLRNDGKCPCRANRSARAFIMFRFAGAVASGIAGYRAGSTGPSGAGAADGCPAP